MKSSILAGALALMGACAFKPGSDSAESKTLEIMNTKEGFKVEVTPRPEPQEYSVKLSWPKVDIGLTLAVRRKEATGQIRSLDVIPSGQTEYHDHAARGGEKYSYVLSLIENKNYRDLATVDIQIPRDLVLSSGSELPDGSHGYHRLFLEKDGVYTVSSDERELSFAELISDGAKLVVGPLSAVAELGEAGASMKSFRLQIGLGRGVLHLVSRGQLGGQGSPGLDGASGGKGGRGNDGKTDSRRDCTFGTTFGFGGPDGPRTPCGKEYFCSHQTGDGGQGERGQSGNPGGEGAHGGNSPAILVSVDDPVGFEVKPTSLPGAGGAGGIGGAGGPGGPGGDPGARDRGKYCRHANPGATGEMGARGPAGPIGKPGEAGAVCLVFGAARFGECEQLEAGAP